MKPKSRKKRKRIDTRALLRGIYGISLTRFKNENRFNVFRVRVTLFYMFELNEMMTCALVKKAQTNKKISGSEGLEKTWDAFCVLPIIESPLHF